MKHPPLTLSEAARIAAKELQLSATKKHYFIGSVSLKEPPPSSNCFKYSVSYELKKASIEAYVPITRGLQIDMNGITSDEYGLYIWGPRPLISQPPISITDALALAIADAEKRQLYSNEDFFPWTICYLSAGITKREPYYSVRYTPFKPNLVPQVLKVRMDGTVFVEENNFYRRP